MKIVVWTNDQPNQVALVNKIQERFGVAGVIIEAKKSVARKSNSGFIAKVYEKLFLGSISGAWMGMLEKCRAEFPTLPGVPVLGVENINCEETIDFTRKLGADLVVVSGTRMIREKLLGLELSLGIINLHTGLSPYVKGGPNCTNWCIATNNFHLIGNTIMWIDKGIDSGNLIATENTPVTGDETLEELHVKVMDHAHELYLRAIDALKNGKQAVPNIAQGTIAQGKTYYTREWTLARKKDLVRNFRNFKAVVDSPAYSQAQKGLTTVKL